MKYKNLKQGDKVVILSGDYKKKIGILLRILRKKDQVIVKGLNLIKKHIKPSNKNEKGRIETKEAPIHISNVAFLDTQLNKPTRLGYKFIEGKKMRYAIKSKTIM
jgi:large subunit ribosomal protein L24